MSHPYLQGEHNPHVDRAAALAAGVVSRNAAAVDESGQFPGESVAALAAAGLFGLCVPAELGGSGESMRTFAAVVEELAPHRRLPRLEAAVRRRAATLAGIGGVPAPVQDALTIYAAGASEPRRVARGHEAFRELLAAMHEGRTRRLRSAGFTAEQASTISELHTPNFM